MRSHLYATAAFAVLGPMALGLVGGIFKTIVFHVAPFQPEEEPAFVFALPIALYLFAISFGLWCAVRRLPQYSPWLLSGIAVFVGSYMFIRSVIAELAIFMRFAYCCCCENLPSLYETVTRVFNPIAF